MALLKICPAPLARFLVATGLSKHLSFFFKMASRSLTEVVNELTDNKDLRAVFSYNFGTYGGTKALLRLCLCSSSSLTSGFALICRQHAERRQLLHAQSAGHPLPQRRLVP